MPSFNRILVTGGAGFIGSNLVRHLLSVGYSVMNVDKLTYAGNLTSLSDVQANSRYEFRQIDITHAPAVQQAVEEFQPQSVMHLAAESHVDRSIDSPQDFIMTNVVGTMNLLQASLKHFLGLPSGDAGSFRFLHVSTDEVYGSLGPAGSFTESTPYDPHSPYSASKAASDHLARAWFHTYGLPVIVTNCSNNYGPYQFPEKLIPVVILKALRGDPIPVYGRGENVRDWLYVGDHCQALQRVIERGRLGQTYNIGGHNELRNIDLVKKLCEILDDLRPRIDGKPYSGQIAFVKDRAGHDLRYAIDATKIARELQWQPQHDCESGFRETVEWYLANAHWWQPIISGEYRMQRLGVRNASLAPVGATS